MNAFFSWQHAVRDTDTAFRLLRAEVQRLAGHRTDRVFLVQKLDAMEAWLKELEQQHAKREAARGS